MPRGEKSKYTGKQERKADHIAEGYKKRGVGSMEAERRAWATVNKDDVAARNLGDLAGASERASLRAQGRPARRQSCCIAIRIGALGIGQEGCSHAQAARTLSFSARAYSLAAAGTLVRLHAFRSAVFRINHERFSHAQSLRR